jgi:hypothetical protein
LVRLKQKITQERSAEKAARLNSGLENSEHDQTKYRDRRDRFGIIS